MEVSWVWGVETRGDGESMSKMPKQKRGSSKQDYGTPKEFLDALRNRLGIVEFDIDLAATPENAKASFYYTEQDDALAPKNSWCGNGGGWSFLNPPFGDIPPWVDKACDESSKGAKIAVLVPASVGANWWREYVDGKAYITYLNGRITFEGCKDPYPKDCAILLYAPYLEGGSCVWKWK